MNNDFKNELGVHDEDPYRYLSNTNCILDAINDLSQKMDKAEEKAREKEKSDFRRFAFSSILGILTLIAGIVAAVAGVLAVLPH